MRCWLSGCVMNCSTDVAKCVTDLVPGCEFRCGETNVWKEYECCLLIWPS